ncbi:MAG TPA: DUF2012 domain-containing protein [Thermoanaerobaculia bacterium]
MRWSLRGVLGILLYVALPASAADGGGMATAAFLTAAEVDQAQVAALNATEEVVALRGRIGEAGFRLVESEVRYVADYSGFVAPVEAADAQAAGRAFLLYRRGAVEEAPSPILVTAFGKNEYGEPYFEYQFADASLRFIAAGETVQASLIPAAEQPANVAAALFRVGVDAWSWDAVQGCFLQSLGISNLTQFSGIVAALCSLPATTKSLVMATGHGISCAAGGVVSCAIFAVYSLCAAAEIVSCVNQTPPPPPDVRLTSGQSQSGQQVRLREWRYYWIDVPAGASSLRVAVSGSGDADLYTRQGTKPTANTYACRPYQTHSDESCTQNNPAAGTWWIGIYGDNPATYSIVATVTAATFSISGSAGTPGAAIAATGGNASHAATANASGTYTFSNLPAGTYTLRPAKANCTFAPVTMTVSIGPNATSRNFTASCVAPPPPSTDPVLSNGQTLTGQTVASGAWRYFRIDVPAGRSRLDVTISGTGDADLYTRSGSKPTSSAYTCRPFKSTSNESCSHSSPAAGQWWIGVRGYSASTFTITARYQ